MPDLHRHPPETSEAEKSVIAIPAPISRSIDQLLQTIAQHQAQTPMPAARDTQTTEATAGDVQSGALTASDTSAADLRAKHLAALLDIVNRLHDERGQDSASRRLVNDLAAHLSTVTDSAVTVSLAMVHESTHRCQLTAASDSLQVDSHCPHNVARQSAAQECLARDAVTLWPARTNQTRHSVLAHQQLAEIDETNTALTVPLKIAGEKTVAVVVCTTTVGEDLKSATMIDEAVRFLTSSAAPLATALQIRQQLDLPWWKKVARRTASIVQSGRYQIAALCLIVLTAAMLIPFDYKVSCDMELQPVSRRFIAAPFAAQLQACLVEPGDVVEEGQILARLDGREIQWELSGVLADLEKAIKERNTHLSERSFGLAAISRHESQRLQNQAALLQARLKQLEIRSPVAGVIVAGDLKDTEGAPLKTGELLFEVAPLDSMKVRVGIPEDDIRHVDVGMATRLQLDAMPSEALETKLVRLNPRAEVFEDENVFIAEAEVSNSDLMLRPGMRGRAWVSTGPQPLGWNLFHKPFAWATSWLGW